MKILLHDLPEEANLALFAGKFDNYMIYADDGTVHQCIGCTSCRQRQSGGCVFDDTGTHFAKSLAECEEIIIISKCVFGSVSPYVKTMLDRSKAYMYPTMELRGGEVSFKTQKNRMRVRVCFYGSASASYEATALKLMRQIAAEWDAADFSVKFYEDPFQIPGGDASCSEP